MKTEVFATLGPACGTYDVITQMIQAGMTGMRLNLSHTTLDASRAYLEAYQKAAEQTDTKPQLLIDMQGPELRVGTMAEEIVLEAGTQGVFVVPEEKRQCKKRWIPIPKAVLDVAEPGDEILLDDGKILVRITEKRQEEEEKTLLFSVLRPGVLKGQKSIKICNKNVKMPVLTAHDIANIRVAKECGVTALMQPFVQNGEELKEVRTLLDTYGAEDLQIFAKIENRQGVQNIESILPYADVIVIARGDLGNDMPLWELPGVQKHIETACKKAKKPYIVVTQMLASMEHNPVPTRAEVSDIFHAVYHGAWGVMVTGETAVGAYPVEVIRYLANTAEVALEYSDKIKEDAANEGNV